jgi:hypothetical protein
MIPNPLDLVWNSYEITADCFKVAQEVVKQQQFELFTSATWPTQPEARRNITKTLREVDDLFVFSLWATFERFVITYLQNKGATLQTIAPLDLAYPLYEQFRKEVEFWNQKEILELLKHLSALDKHSIGQAKQILDYRNWIAHGKDIHKKSMVKTMTPVYTYQILNDIVTVLLLN